MREYYTDAQVVDVLKRCEAAGINTIQARGDYHRILYWMELFRREGQPLATIAIAVQDGERYLQADFGNYRQTGELP